MWFRLSSLGFDVTWFELQSRRTPQWLESGIVWLIARLVTRTLGAWGLDISCTHRRYSWPFDTLVFLNPLGHSGVPKKIWFPDFAFCLTFFNYFGTIIFLNYRYVSQF